MLAEGSKMVVVTQPSAAQGVYGLVANLGGLVVRTAFQPFEEAAFTAFSTNRGTSSPTPDPGLRCSFGASSAYSLHGLLLPVKSGNAAVHCSTPAHTVKEQCLCGRCTFAQLNIDAIASQLQKTATATTSAPNCACKAMCHVQRAQAP